MSAHLDGTLVSFVLDSSHIVLIFVIIAMVQLSSAWFSRECTFLICSFFAHCSDRFFVAYMEVVHILPVHIMDNTSSIISFSSYLCSDFLLLYKSEWPLVYQVHSKEVDLDFIYHGFKLCLGHCCYGFRHSSSSFDHAHGCVYISNRNTPGRHHIDGYCSLHLHCHRLGKSRSTSVGCLVRVLGIFLEQN